MSEVTPDQTSWWEKTLSWLPLTLALLSTALFALYTWHLAIEIVTIGNVNQSRFQHFLAGAPNSMGDTLAGFVGSLTLIWVVASVVQQSMELRAQRAEFREMVRAQDAQVQALEAQRSIFLDEQEQRHQDVRSKVLDSLLADLARTCEFTNMLVSWQFYNHPDDFAGMVDDAGNLKREPPRTEHRPFGDFSKLPLDERVYQLGKSLAFTFLAICHDGTHTRCVRKANPDFIRQILERIEIIFEKSKQAGEAQKVRIDALKLEVMKHHLESLSRLDIWEPPFSDHEEGHS